MNSIDDVDDELFGGNAAARAEGIDKISAIRRRVLGLPYDQETNVMALRKRLAPSLITRADAECFGVAMPRFAIRLYLDPEGDSFINLRRAARFHERLRVERPPFGWAGRLSPSESRNLRTDINFDAAAASVAPDFPGILADSVLQVPPQLEPEYAIRVRDFNPMYDARARRAIGTSYVYHKGVGQCSDACCFMASMMLYEHVRNIYALIEIQAIAANPQLGEVAFSGLTPLEIKSYFENARVHLSAIPQVVEGANYDRQDERLLAIALRAYTKSGCPVIVYTDLRRMFGVASPNCTVDVQPIYGAEGLNVTLNSATVPAQDRRWPHAVLVIGSSTDNSDWFVFHDPAVMPYVEATSGQLLAGSPYSSDIMNSLHRGWIQPVTAPGVKMPLFDTEQLAGSERVRLAGLRSIAAEWLTRFHERDKALGIEDDWLVGDLLNAEYRLLQCQDLLSRGVSIVEDIVGRDSFIADHFRSLARSVPPSKNGAWVWIQVMRSEVWVWNASAEPIPINAEKKPLSHKLVQDLAFAMANRSSFNTQWT